ncbi:hypothetical protein [Streptomyces canus]|uniref:hypothetical protein n=1 Tax=Streptomyces canus TaxID=58343 RepID=UPI0027866D77|nr:hypothetical protein [Streptomyces canus]MDQ1068082.1 hypothetical protein [Streptomyces canus]
MTGEGATSDRDGHGMGDERSGDAPGRRHARPEETLRGRTARERQSHDDTAHDDTAHDDTAHDDTAPAPTAPYDSPLEALLAAALRGEKSDGEAERRAVAAFRAARDAGVHRARTRRRDDWRPRSQRRRARSLKATLSVLLASLTLGGVAYAAIGSTGGGEPKGAVSGKDVRPSVSASTPAESHSSARPTASAPAERPPTAKDTLAHCRAYEKLRGRGKALDSTAYQRLVTAAGGEANVSAYCATLTGPGTGTGAGTADANGANDAGDAKPGKRKARTSAPQNADKNKSKKQ